MIIGIPKEIKNNENRVSMTPSGIYALVKNGHVVKVEDNAGLGSGIDNCEYIKAGAKVVQTGQEAYDADMVIKVKEPLGSEYEYFKEGQILFTYLHLAPNPNLTNALLKSKVTGIAYETIYDQNKSLPLLVPMSEVAGRMSVQVGATMLQKYNGGMGILLGGVPGVESAKVVIIGGGIVGTNAAKMAVGLGADVTILDINKNRLVFLDDIFGNRIKTLVCDDYNIRQSTQNADLLIGAVLIAGAKAPKLVTEDMVKNMKKGSVIVDVAIDQGGCIETSDRVTTHDEPVYEKYGVVHYSVANMPGAVPKTSTFALTGSTLPYIIKLANRGLEVLSEDVGFAAGLNTYNGNLTNMNVADALGFEYNRYQFGN